MPVEINSNEKFVVVSTCRPTHAAHLLILQPWSLTFWPQVSACQRPATECVCVLILMLIAQAV